METSSMPIRHGDVFARRLAGRSQYPDFHGDALLSDKLEWEDYDYFRHKYNIQEELRLREQETGFGKRIRDLRQEFPQREYHGNLYYRFFGGESGADVYDRVSAFVEKLHRHFLTESCPQNFIIVSHGSTIKIMMMRLLHWTVDEFQQYEATKNAEIAVLEKTEDCRLKLVSPVRRRYCSATLKSLNLSFPEVSAASRGATISPFSPDGGLNSSLPLLRRDVLSPPGSAKQVTNKGQATSITEAMDIPEPLHLWDKASSRSAETLLGLVDSTSHREHAETDIDFLYSRRRQGIEHDLDPLIYSSHVTAAASDGASSSRFATERLQAATPNTSQYETLIPSPEARIFSKSEEHAREMPFEDCLRSRSSDSWETELMRVFGRDRRYSLLDGPLSVDLRTTMSGIHEQLPATSCGSSSKLPALVEQRAVAFPLVSPRNNLKMGHSTSSPAVQALGQSPSACISRTTAAATAFPPENRMRDWNLLDSILSPANLSPLKHVNGAPKFSREDHSSTSSVDHRVLDAWHKAQESGGKIGPMSPKWRRCESTHTTACSLPNLLGFEQLDKMCTSQSASTSVSNASSCETHGSRCLVAIELPSTSDNEEEGSEEF